MTPAVVSLSLVLATLSASPSVDLSHATVVGRGALAPVAEQTAARCLVEEIERRTGIKLPTSDQIAKEGAAIVVFALGPRDEAPDEMPTALEQRARALRPEGYALLADTQLPGRPTIWVVGADSRGALFGVGHLLRLLELRDKQIGLDQAVDLQSAPAYPMRGHQLGYRNRANSWDAWDEAQFEQYIRDLALCGSNCIENIPFQDESKSPHMRVSRERMNVAMSEICQRYDLDYWIWNPAEFDLADNALRQKAIDEHVAFFRDCPRLDGVFFPGGDPGDNRVELVLDYLEQLAVPLAASHPRAGIWLSLQGFDDAQVDVFYRYLETKQPKWLTGVVAGPSSPPIPETRLRLPARYQLRHYPDITHTVRAQYPVPWWDQAFDVTLGREAPNPLPTYSRLLHNWFAPYTVGFLSYSDGVHDDVNKVIWSRLAWDPDATTNDVLNDYCRLFFGPDVAPRAVDGLLALERNYQGALVDNGGVEATLALWQSLDAQAPQLRDNWRWQMCQLRAVYDAYTRRRLIYETAIEDDMNAVLANAKAENVDAAIDTGLTILERADQSTAPDLRKQIDDLCAALFKSIGLQTSMEKYGASGAERGCLLDFVDHPLNNRWYLEDELARLRMLSSPADRVAAVKLLAAWEHPGPGSFYDDVGHPAKSPHVVRGEQLNTDPLMMHNPSPEYLWWDSGRSRQRLAWMSVMNWPLGMKYEGLDPSAKYVVRLTGYRDSPLRIDGQRVAATIDGRGIGEIKEFPVPAEALRDGKLLLTWDAIHEPNLNWREQSRLSEVWLIKQ